MNKNQEYQLEKIKLDQQNQQFKKENTELLKLNQSIKQQNIKKKILDIIEETDFNFILQHIESFDFNSKRNKLALIILYITGIKLNFLLKFKVKDLKSLLKHKLFTLPLKNNNSLLAYILKKHDKYLSEVENCSKTVIENKKNSDFIFTKKNEEKSLSRETLTRALNTILKNAGENLKKKKIFSTHSFRISYIKNLSEILPVNEISQIIGHKNVNSTVKYYKDNNLSIKEKKKIFKKANINIEEKRRFTQK